MGHSLKESLKYGLRSYPLIRKYVREIEGMYAMRSADLKKRNEERFLAILHHAYHQSKFYRRLYDQAHVDISLSLIHI